MFLGEREPLTTLSKRARRGSVSAASGALHALLMHPALVVDDGWPVGRRRGSARARRTGTVFLNLAGPRGGGGGGAEFRGRSSAPNARARSSARCQSPVPDVLCTPPNRDPPAPPPPAPAPRARRQRSIRRPRRHRPGGERASRRSQLIRGIGIGTPTAPPAQREARDRARAERGTGGTGVGRSGTRRRIWRRRWRPVPRPGAGIEPPSLLREVKASYEIARRPGDVDLEIVVRHDGSVGDVRVLRGLGAGLNEKAVEAVRQWRFFQRPNAARRG